MPSGTPSSFPPGSSPNIRPLVRISPGAIKQAMLTVICVPVRVTQCNDFFFASVEIKAINLVLHFIANVEKTGWVPHWAFGKAEAPANPGELGIMIYELPKFWRFGLQFEAP